MTLVPVQKLCVNNIYMYVHSLYEFCYRTHTHTYIYMYIQRECHSVLAKLHPITFCRIVFLGSAQFTPVKIAFGVDKINNKLNFCMELGNIVGDHLPKVPKNPRLAS